MQCSESDASKNGPALVALQQDPIGARGGRNTHLYEVHRWRAVGRGLVVRHWQPNRGLLVDQCARLLEDAIGVTGDVSASYSISVTGATSAEGVPLSFG